MPLIFRCDTCGGEQDAGLTADTADFYIECQGCGQDLCTECAISDYDQPLCDFCARDAEREAELEAKEGSDA